MAAATAATAVGSVARRRQHRRLSRARGAKCVVLARGGQELRQEVQGGLAVGKDQDGGGGDDDKLKVLDLALDPATMRRLTTKLEDFIAAKNRVVQVESRGPGTRETSGPAVPRQPQSPYRLWAKDNEADIVSWLREQLGEKWETMAEKEKAALCAKEAAASWAEVSDAVKGEYERMSDKIREELATYNAHEEIEMAKLQAELDEFGRQSEGVEVLEHTTKQQLRLINRVVNNRQSIFMTGAAGTGKTLTLRSLIRAVRSRCSPEEIGITALTGMAASHLPGGRTLHRWAGWGDANGDKETLLGKVSRDPRARQRWRMVKFLIIDEVSMLASFDFSKLDYIARELRADDRPFGGITLILCGDFFQLPPVLDGTGRRKAKTKQSRNWCFDSEVWKEVMAPTGEEESCFELTQVFRQTDDKLLRLLRQVRSNELTKWGAQLLDDLARPLTPPPGILPMQLCSRRFEVDYCNEFYFNMLEGDEVTYAAKDTVLSRPEGLPDQLASMEKWDRHFSLERSLCLKIGAQVVLNKNVLWSDTVVNGSRGVVIGFSDDGPVVRFANGEEVDFDELRSEEVYSFGPGKGAYIREQFPLTLSWALTIHKCQGMTLDMVEVSLNSTFSHGQVYTALSRARSCSNLRVLGWDPKKIEVDEAVAEFYRKRVRPA